VGDTPDGELLPVRGDRPTWRVSHAAVVVPERLDPFGRSVCPLGHRRTVRPEVADRQRVKYQRDERDAWL